jgi:hypothetical protein
VKSGITFTPAIRRSTSQPPPIDLGSRASWSASAQAPTPETDAARRRSTPLHYAADGNPASPKWNPVAQAETIACLIASGADPNAVDKNGVTALHRAVRTRCAWAVSALLQGAADALRKNSAGSTPMILATRQTGRGGRRSPMAKMQQAEIIRLLEPYDGP